MITFLCFAPDLRGALLEWDDVGYIVHNPHIRSLSSDTVYWAFSEFYLNYWAPLTWLSLAFDYAAWEINPVGYHLTNNIIHALNAGMFFLISLGLLKRHLAAVPRNTVQVPIITAQNAVFCALLAAIFFAIHPLRAESVAWATERKDVLSLFFGLSAVLAYLSHTKASSAPDELSGQKHFFAFTIYYWLALFLYCLSLLSKTLMVTLPLVLLVLDWFPLNRLVRHEIKGVLLEKIPFLLLAGITSVIAMKSQAVAIFSFDDINMTTRLLNAFKSIMAYLRLTVWPFGLSPFYVHPMNIPGISIEYAVPIVVFILLSLCFALMAKRRPVFMAAWLIYLLTLSPFLGITQVGPQAMAGRFTYLCGLPLALLFAVGITGAFSRLSGSRPAVICLSSAVAVIILISGYLTIREISFWRDDVTLWSRVIDLDPHSTGRAYFQRSHAYFSRGELSKALADIDEALAIAIKKKYKLLHEIYRERARILIGLGDLDGAIADYTTALGLAKPNNRSYLYMERGDIYERQGKSTLAKKDFNLATVADGNSTGNQP